MVGVYIELYALLRDCDVGLFLVVWLVRWCIVVFVWLLATAWVALLELLRKGIVYMCVGLLLQLVCILLFGFRLRLLRLLFVLFGCLLVLVGDCLCIWLLLWVFWLVGECYVVYLVAVNVECYVLFDCNNCCFNYFVLVAWLFACCWLWFACLCLLLFCFVV